MSINYEEVAFTVRDWEYVETPTARLDRSQVCRVEAERGEVTLYLTDMQKISKAMYPRNACRFMRPVQADPPNPFAAHSLSGVRRRK